MSTLGRRKTYGVSTSGWSAQHIQQLKEAMDSQKVNGWAKHGLLCFDEVGLVAGSLCHFSVRLD